jgi:hypothetical protein
VRSNARENGQIGRATTVRAAQGDGSRPRHPPVLPERRISAKIRAGSGFIWGIPAEMAGQEIDRLGDPSATDEERQLRKRRLIKGPNEFRDIRSKRTKG